MVYEMLDEDIPIIHYIFTKYSFRHLGLARHLLGLICDPNLVVLYSHRTRGSDKMAQFYPKAIYDPYLLYDGDWR